MKVIADGDLWSDPAEVQTALRLSLAAVAIPIWEWLINLEDEVELIWRSKITPVKCLYISLRYFVLAAELSYQMFVLAFHPAFSVLLVETCMMRYIFQSALSGLVLLLVEVLLMMRVYALFSGSRQVVLLISLLIVGGLGLRVYASYGAFKVLRFSDDCVATRAPPPVLICSAVALVTQTTLWGLTMFKSWQSCGSSPLFMKLVVDGGVSFCFTCAVLILLSTYGLSQNVFPHIVYSWFISLMSPSCCRFIINMQLLVKRKRGLDEMRDESLAVQLSTNVWLEPSRTVGALREGEDGC